MLSTVQRTDKIYFKRNDLNEFGGCFGGKAECIYEFIKKSEVKTFVTCGSRDSLQCEIVSQMCCNLGYDCHIFTPSGQETPSIRKIANSGAVLHPIDNGRIVVVKKRASDFAKENDFTLIPFGMQTLTAISVVASQVENIPYGIKRIVVPVGGGITMCGVMQGLVRYGRTDIEVLGVITGGNPEKIINAYKPKFNPIKYTLVPWEIGTPNKRYSDRVDIEVGGIKLDSVYEGKCAKFLKDYDLLWIVGYHEV